MPQFLYKAKKGPTETVVGTIVAESQAQAVAQLVKSGHVPLEVKLSDDASSKLPTNLPIKSKSSVSPQALEAFTRQLADLLDAGIPLLRAMQLLSRQGQFPAMRPLIQSLISALEQGQSLSKALSMFPETFPPLYYNTVKAAEASGKLPLVMDRLAQFLENDFLLRSKIRSSLLYPLIIFGVGTLTVIALLTFVLPKLTLIYEDFDATLPWLTTVVMAMSRFFARAWWLLGIISVGIGVLLRAYWQSPSGKIALDMAGRRIIFLKTFIENVQISRFARTLGMLLESGVPVVAALESVSLVVDHHVLYQDVKKMTLRVKEGAGLAQAIKESTFFPEAAVDLISVGQESGKLEKGLYKLASSCERKANEMAQAFVTILGPAALVVVVAIVAVMIIAVLLPMLQMNLIVK